MTLCPPLLNLQLPQRLRRDRPPSLDPMFTIQQDCLTKTIPFRRPHRHGFHLAPLAHQLPRHRPTRSTGGRRIHITGSRRTGCRCIGLHCIQQRLHTRACLSHVSTGAQHPHQVRGRAVAPPPAVASSEQRDRPAQRQLGINSLPVAGDLPQDRAPPQQAGTPWRQQPPSQRDRVTQRAAGSGHPPQQNRPADLDHGQQHQRRRGMQPDRDRIRPPTRRVRDDRADRQDTNQLTQPTQRHANPSQHQIQHHHRDQTTIDTSRHQTGQRHAPLRGQPRHGDVRPSQAIAGHGHTQRHRHRHSDALPTAQSPGLTLHRHGASPTRPSALSRTHRGRHRAHRSHPPAGGRSDRTWHIRARAEPEQTDTTRHTPTLSDTIQCPRPANLRYSDTIRHLLIRTAAGS